MFIHCIPDKERSELESTYLRELQNYRPTPSFFGTVPRSEEGIVVSYTHLHYVPVSEGVTTILELAEWYVESSGLHVDPMHATVEYWLFSYQDAAFHDTSSCSSSPKDDAHLCIFLLHQDKLISPTYVDVFPDNESMWSYLGFGNEECTTHCLQPGTVLVIPANWRFKLHGCSGFGARHLIYVYMKAT